jgi:DNA-directed RNA polymerase subunit RPC12/RpoP
MDQKAIPSAFDWAPGQRSSGKYSVDYLCGNCGIILLHAEDGLAHNLVILCTECGARNSSGAPTIPAAAGTFR